MMSADYGEDESAAAGAAEAELQHHVGSNVEIEQSVVPDLMRVYADLTRSSTPFSGPFEGDPFEGESFGGALPPSNGHHQHQHQHQHQPPAKAVPYPQDQDGRYERCFSPPPLPTPAPTPAPAPAMMMPRLPTDGAAAVHAYDQYESQVQRLIAQQVPSQPPVPRSRQGQWRKRRRQQGQLPAAATTDPDSKHARSRGRRSASSSPRGRKKSASGDDGRWSKRFQWPDGLHREFVAAVYDVGLRHSNPSAVMEGMLPIRAGGIGNGDGDGDGDGGLPMMVTPEKIASHLKRYRMHRARSKEQLGLDPDNNDASGRAEEEGGDGAGGRERGSVLHLPRLTPEEKSSPVGISMGYLVGIFSALQQQLVQQRAEEAAETDSEAEVEAELAGSTGAESDARPHQQLHQQLHQPGAVLSQSPRGSGASTPRAGNGGSLSNSTSAILEVNNLMKRDMRAQMGIQNQMRALKNKEVAKVRASAPSHAQAADGLCSSGDGAAATEHHNQHSGGETSGGEVGGIAISLGAIASASSGGGLLSPGASGVGLSGAQSPNARARTMSFTDDLLNSAVSDEQLFEFLMS